MLSKLIVFLLFAITVTVSAQEPNPAATPKPSSVLSAETRKFFNELGSDLDQAEIYARRASNCDAKKDYACAVANYTKAIALEPFRARHFFRRGKAFMSLSKNAEAIADLNRGLTIDAKDLSAYKDLAIVYAGSGQYEKAIDTYHSAIKTAPTFENYVLLTTGTNLIFKFLADSNQTIPPAVDLDEALKASNTALRMEPDKPVNYLAYAERAKTYRNLARLGRPVVALAEADEKKGSEQLSLWTKAMIAKLEVVNAEKEKTLNFERSMTPYFKVKDYAGAVRAATNAIALDGKMSAAYVDRAKALIAIDKYRDAIADTDKAIAIFPEYEDAFSTRGWAKSMKGDFADAIADFNRAIEIDQTKAFATGQRGIIYLFQGDYDLAEIDFLRVLDLDPQNVTAKENLASLAELKASGYNAGKVKDDALITYIQLSRAISAQNKIVGDRFNTYADATEERPRDNSKVCRLLADADVSIMVIDSLLDRLKQLIADGGMERLQSYKRTGLATIDALSAYRPRINSEATSQGCKK